MGKLILKQERPDYIGQISHKLNHIKKSCLYPALGERWLAGYIWAIRRLPQGPEIIWDVLLSPIFKGEDTTDIFSKMPTERTRKFSTVLLFTLI